MDEELGVGVAFRSIREQAALIQRRELSPVELTEEYLRRIEAVDPELNCFITVFHEGARLAARAMESEVARGQIRGPLHGIPFAVKDVFDIAGSVTTGGLSCPSWYAASEDATVIRRLKEAGAVLIGTLNTHELQLGGTTIFSYGTPRNPYDFETITGGSSSGSASAVAAGLCSFSLGGDTGGSVRVPASYCGVVGLKPTWSRVSRHGVMQALWSLDCVGILSREVGDAALVLRAIAGHDPRDPTSSRHEIAFEPEQCARSMPKSGLRVGFVRQFFDPEVVNEDVLRAATEVVSSLEKSGACVSEVSFQGLKSVHAVHHALVDANVASARSTLLVESARKLDRNTRIRLLAGSAVPAQVHGLAERARAAVAREVWSAMQEVDLLIGPSTPTTAPLRVAGNAPRELQNLVAEFNRPYSFAGVPALSVPVGTDGAGLPIGIQLAAAPFKEPELLEISSRFSTYHEPNLRA